MSDFFKDHHDEIVRLATEIAKIIRSQAIARSMPIPKYKPVRPPASVGERGPEVIRGINGDITIPVKSKIL